MQNSLGNCGMIGPNIYKIIVYIHTDRQNSYSMYFISIYRGQVKGDNFENNYRTNKPNAAQLMIINIPVLSLSR